MNGHYLDLHGVSVHQDRLNQGWAITNANIDQDFSLITAMGALAGFLSSAHQTYRYGASFSYNVPLVNGTYTLFLNFMEPTMIGSGQRVFSVSANGAAILTNFDIYSQVGQHVALQKQFTVTVTGGTLALNFTASVNNALICAFALVQAA